MLQSHTLRDQMRLLLIKSMRIDACTIDIAAQVLLQNHKNDAPGKVFLPSMFTVYSKIPSSVATNLSVRVNTVSKQELSGSYRFRPSSLHPIPIVARPSCCLGVL